MTALYADNLTGARGVHTLFRDLSFSVSAGELLCLCGPNGSGKTSLLRLLAGLLPLQNGIIRFKPDQQKTSGTLHSSIHWCGPKTALHNVLTVRQNLAFWARLYACGDPAQAVTASLAFWDLADHTDKAARYLSTGQKQRLSLARLNLTPRPVWLLDEPAASLDQKNRARLQNSLKTHLSNGGLAVIATHSPARWETTTDKLNIIDMNAHNTTPSGTGAGA